MENNIRNGLIQWRISTSIKLIIEHFSLALTVFRMSDQDETITEEKNQKLRFFSIKNYLNQNGNTHKVHFVEFTNSTRHPIHRLSNVIFSTMHSCRSY